MIFDQNAYYSMCPLCQFMPPQRYPWDDSLPMEYCPRDGMRLERIACTHCGGPLRLTGERRHHSMVTAYAAVVFGGGYVEYKPEPFCPYCGESTAPPQEPKLREKPAPKKKKAKKEKPRNIEVHGPESFAQLIDLRCADCGETPRDCTCTSDDDEEDCNGK